MKIRWFIVLFLFLFNSCTSRGLLKIQFVFNTYEKDYTALVQELDENKYYYSYSNLYEYNKSIEESPVIKALLEKLNIKSVHPFEGGYLFILWSFPPDSIDGIAYVRNFERFKVITDDQKHIRGNWYRFKDI